MQTPSANLIAAATAANRIPAYCVEVKWDGTNYVDETSNTLLSDGLSGTSEGGALDVSPSPLGPSVADELSLTFDNSGGRFSWAIDRELPDYLYDYLYEDGGFSKLIRVKTGMLYGGSPEYVTQFIGHMKEPVQSGGYGDRVSISAQGLASRVAMQQVSTPLQVNQRADEYIATLAALLPAGLVSSVVCDYGITVHPYLWADEESVWQEMQEVAKAEGGRVFFDNAGVLRFHNYLHLAQNTSPVATFTQSHFLSVRPSISYANIRNHIIVKYRPRYIGGYQTIWKCSEPIEVPPNSHVYRWAQLQNPAHTVTDPVSGTDWKARTSSYVDRTSDLTVTRSTTYAQRVYLDLHNTHATLTLYADPLQLRGYPVLTTEERMVEATATPYTRGERVETVDSVYLQSEDIAQALASSMLYRYKDPRIVARVQLVRGALPYLEVGDRIHLDDSGTGGTGVHRDFYVASIDWVGTREVYQQELTLLDAANLVPHDDYFWVGTDAAHNTALGAVGKMFW